MKQGVDVKVFLSHLPTLAGVYQMRDAAGKVLYVGKAKNLKKRVSSYFRHTGLSAKTQALMAKVVDIQTTVTNSETEAFILENNLIKTHQPRFNILLRDDKTYPYLHLSAHEFPRLAFYRGKRKQGEYFGPYPNAQAARYAMDMLQRVFRVRQCEDSFFANRSRPCLQYQIKRCYAPCVGYIDKASYAETVLHTSAFLTGRSEALQQQLQHSMLAASDAQEYEKAAIIRDQLRQLRSVVETQHMVVGQADVDVLAVETAYGEGCVQVLFYRNGHNVATQAYYPKLPDEHESKAEILSAFMAQFYAERMPPAQVILSEALPDEEALSAFLSQRAGRKVSLSHSPRAEKRKWLMMAMKNAQLNLSQYVSGKLTMQARFEQLAEAFSLPCVPNRIECVDVSHTQGVATVASCVVFDRRGALKSQYRRYNIREVKAGDDYAAIRQVVRRRFTRLQEETNKAAEPSAVAQLPDVFLIDGGRGQLRQAVEVLAELGITGVQLIGVAKGEGRKAGLEQFWFPHEKIARALPRESQAMQLMVQIRDEAHRFAIVGHRAGRSKTSHASVLTQIAGVGVKRRQALLKYFGGLAMLEKASVEDIAAVPNIGWQLAEEIYNTLHPKG